MCFSPCVCLVKGLYCSSNLELSSRAHTHAHTGHTDTHTHKTHRHTYTQDTHEFCILSLDLLGLSRTSGFLRHIEHFSDIIEQGWGEREREKFVQYICTSLCRVIELGAGTGILGLWLWASFLLPLRSRAVFPPSESSSSDLGKVVSPPPVFFLSVSVYVCVCVFACVCVCRLCLSL